MCRIAIIVAVVLAGACTEDPTPVPDAGPVDASGPIDAPPSTNITCNLATKTCALGRTGTYDHVIAFSRGAQAYVLAYASKSGQVELFTVDEKGGRSVAVLFGVTGWERNLSALVPFTLGRDAMVLAYSTSGGNAVIRRVADRGAPFVNTFVGRWETAWTHFAVLGVGAARYLYRYRSSSGERSIWSIAADGSAITRVTARESIDKNWSRFGSFAGASPIVLAYQRTAGLVLVNELVDVASKARLTKRQSDSWGTEWTHLSSFSTASELRVALYDDASGRWEVRGIPKATPSTPARVVGKGTWRKGVRRIVPLPLSPTPYFLLD